MAKNIYFAVGSDHSTAQLSRFSWADMQQRSLNDPRFAACEPNFNWRNYIELQFTDKMLEREVSKTLDQFGRTPEGQHTIRQAFAMQNYRVRSGQSNYGRDQEGKLFITDQTNAAVTAFGVNINGVAVYKPEMEAHSLKGRDGNYYHQTLPMQLYHELCHAKDGFFGVDQQMRYYNEVKRDEFMRDKATIASAAPASKQSLRAELIEKQASMYEYPAIRETNEFMQKYYEESPRALRHDAIRDNTWYNELIGRTQEQPHLPTGISYDHIVNQPVPNCKPVVSKGQRR